MSKTNQLQDKILEFACRLADMSGLPVQQVQELIIVEMDDEIQRLSNKYDSGQHDTDDIESQMPPIKSIDFAVGVFTT